MTIRLMNFIHRPFLLCILFNFQKKYTAFQYIFEYILDNYMEKWYN